MRVYYLVLTLFIQTLCLIAQPADAVKLSSEQIALIQNQGTSAIKTVFEELDIDIQDLPTVEAFALEASAAQLNGSISLKTINEIASSITIALAEISADKNSKTNYVIEYAAAGIAHGITLASINNNSDVLKSIINASEGVVRGAIEFSANTGADFDEIVSAVGSGYLAGTIEASNENGINVISAVKASSNGLISGAINSTLTNNVEIYETLSSTCEGVAEAAVEASVREQLDLIKQITAASVQAGESGVKAATELGLEIDLAKKAILKGLQRGTIDSIPGKGNNVRIMIAPQKDINAYELIENIKAGIDKGGFEAGFFPIIETPIEDDPIVRQVSPIN